MAIINEALKINNDSEKKRCFKDFNNENSCKLQNHENKLDNYN